MAAVKSLRAVVVNKTLNATGGKKRSRRAAHMCEPPNLAGATGKSAATTRSRPPPPGGLHRYQDAARKKAHFLHLGGRKHCSKRGQCQPNYVSRPSTAAWARRCMHAPALTPDGKMFVWDWKDEALTVSLHERLLERGVLGSSLAIPASGGAHIQQFVPHLEGPGRNAHSSHTPGETRSATADRPGTHQRGPTTAAGHHAQH